MLASSWAYYLFFVRLFISLTAPKKSGFFYFFLMFLLLSTVRKNSKMTDKK